MPTATKASTKSALNVVPPEKEVGAIAPLGFFE
jgi:hypothetical protein